MTTEPDGHPAILGSDGGSPSLGPGSSAGVGGAGTGGGGSDGTAEEAPLLRRTRLRLLAWSGGITLVILIALGVAVYAAVANMLDANLTTPLEHRAQDIAALVQRSGFPGRPQVGIAFGGAAGGTIAFVVGPGGSVQGATGLELPQGLPDSGGVAAALRSGSDVRDATVSGIPVRIYSLAVPGHDGTYVVQVIGDRTAEERLLGTLAEVLGFGGLAALLLALAAGYIYAGYALVPIRLSIRRRQEALRRQREFTANASHELRTPLTVIRASVADLRRNRTRPVQDVGEALDDIDSEVSHLTALVDDLLLLARADSGAVEIARVPVDLADVAAEAAGLLAPVGAERGVSVLVDPRPAELIGDPLRLRQLVTILVDNAIAHSPAGGTVLVRVRREAEAATLDVADEGPGIREEDLGRVFERFWRADDAPAGGTGLGLSIARWIVERHGGTISASNRPEGGALFEARLAAPPTKDTTRDWDEEHPAASDFAA